MVDINRIYRYPNIEGRLKAKMKVFLRYGKELVN